MTSIPEDMKFLPLRKKKWAMSEDESWAALEAREVSFGFLGTHGVKAEGNIPYVVPITFAADKANNQIYFHATMDDDSKKIKAIKENPVVSFSAVAESAMIHGTEGEPCKYSATFTSVMTYGEIKEITAFEEKRIILNFLARQKTIPEATLEVPDMMIYVTRVYTLKVRHISGARKG